MSGVWIVTCSADAVPALAGVAAGLGDDVTTVVVGSEAAESGAPEVVRQVTEAGPAVVLGSSRASDRVLLGAIAGAAGWPLLGGVVAVDRESVTRSLHGGIAEQTERRPERAVLCVPEGGPSAQGGPSAHADLRSARRVVAFGRGVRTPEQFAHVTALANALGATLARSRPLAEDPDWLPDVGYVGVSGHRIAPELYVAVAISGQLQHMVGVEGAGTIVAINSDPTAPVFGVCDYGVVGDLAAVLPALTRALEERA